MASTTPGYSRVARPLTLGQPTRIRMSDEAAEMQAALEVPGIAAIHRKITQMMVTYHEDGGAPLQIQEKLDALIDDAENYCAPDEFRDVWWRYLRELDDFNEGVTRKEPVRPRRGVLSNATRICRTRLTRSGAVRRARSASSCFC